MQELTVAFRQNDLHTLLRLEMEWIENEGGNVERLTEEKLGVYSEVLAGQVDGLEKRLRDLSFHPRYRPIVVFNCGVFQTMDGPTAAHELDENIAEIERSLALMQTAKTTEDIHAATSSLRPAAPFPHTD